MKGYSPFAPTSHAPVASSVSEPLPARAVGPDLDSGNRTIARLKDDGKRALEANLRRRHGIALPVSRDGGFVGPRAQRRCSDCPQPPLRDV